MKETHQFIVGPRARFLLQELEAVLHQPPHFGADVGYLEGQMVQARPALRQKFVQRPAGVVGGHQFQFGGGGLGGKKAGRDALRGHGFLLVGGAAEKAREKVVGGGEVGNGNADVVEFHGLGLENV